jgi:hypothetical protein
VADQTEFELNASQIRALSLKAHDSDMKVWVDVTPDGRCVTKVRFVRSPKGVPAITETKNSAGKKALDADIKQILDNARKEVAVKASEKADVWANRVYMKAREANSATVSEYNVNAAKGYVKEQGYVSGLFRRQGRATYAPSTISNPAFTEKEKSSIAEFLQSRGSGGTVRVASRIELGIWSINLHYDLSGQPHGGIHTPHVQFDSSTRKNGMHHAAHHTRPMTFSETQELMNAPDTHPKWAIDWVKEVIEATGSSS